MSLIYDAEGHRKYLTATERMAFLGASAQLPRQAHLFCLLLAYTGARISEILSLTWSQIDYDAGVLIIETMKKRRRGVFRAVPVPSSLLYELRHEAGRAFGPENAALWRFGRTTAWKYVKRAMKAASLDGPSATPKGLRHTFAVSALQSGVPITLVRKWLGHSRIETTAIYANVVGKEEHAFAERMWEDYCKVRK